MTAPVDSAAVRAALEAAGIDVKRDRAAILDCMEPEFFWDALDGESGGDLSDVCCDLETHEVMKVQGAYAGSYRWAASLEREDGTDEIKLFDTRDGAKAACDASKAAAALRDAADGVAQ